MASDPPLARIGATFRLLMQVRVLASGLALLLVPRDRADLETIFVLSCVGALSALALFGWQEIVPRLIGYPVLLALDALIVYAALEVGGVLGPFFLVTAITSTVAGLLFQWSGTLLICPLQVLLYYAAAADSAWAASFQTVLGMPLCYFIGGFVGTALRRLFDEFAQSDEARHRAEIAAAAAEERTRLAREMHDSLVKTLRGISMSASALPAWVSRSPDRAREEAQRIVAAAEIASREARELIAELRTDTARRPLDEIVGDIAGSWAAAAGVEAQVSADSGVELPIRTRHEVAAILREALENVKRHADAPSIEVRLQNGGGRVVLTIADHGKGFAMPADVDDLARDGHYGVVGMRERAAHAGAEMTVTSEPGEGTTVTVTVPIPDGAQAPAPYLEVA
ncbi:histidine kinase [Actinomadura sp. 7K507]|uniref:sensor histidine kinase n=1 Tax=Actinomadura sp. 7K507 TaxID=2530365 RepID=UPI0010506390|nr:histidine kinase [Actinomadura sp. 7K507]TDC80849.1 hypothetical protein E1285_33985 [Actinomadura sp. 7K507]